MKILSKIYICLIFLLLYAPVIVMIVFSFNSSNSLSEFSGFSLRFYKEAFNNSKVIDSFKNTLILAVTTAAVSGILGTAAAVGISRMRSKYLRTTLLSVTNIPMMNPDIVTGVSMMLLFVAVAGIIKANNFMGFGTMLVAHTTFNLPYVLLSVTPRFTQLDRSLSEAAQDLGCTPARAFFSVELPEIIPGIVSGLMLAFTMSLDDFVISHFVSSPTFQTLPLYVYNQTVHNVKFSMYALCAIIVATILVILIAVNFAGSYGNRKKQGVRRGGRSK